jgi:hypothetical protein
MTSRAEADGARRLAWELARAWINGDRTRVSAEIAGLGLDVASPAGLLIAHLVDEYHDALMWLAGLPEETPEDIEASAITTAVSFGLEGELSPGTDLSAASISAARDRVAASHAAMDAAKAAATAALDARLETL